MLQPTLEHSGKWCSVPDVRGGLHDDRTSSCKFSCMVCQVQTVPYNITISHCACYGSSLWPVSYVLKSCHVTDAGSICNEKITGSCVCVCEDVCVCVRAELHRWER